MTSITHHYLQEIVASAFFEHHKESHTVLQETLRRPFGSSLAVLGCHNGYKDSVLYGMITLSFQMLSRRSGMYVWIMF
jgi:hypothetical protein